MKLLLSVVILATIAQGFHVSEERSLIGGIVQNAVERLQNLLDSAVNDLHDLLVNHIASVAALVNNSLAAVSHLVTNSLNLIGGLLDDARNAGKEVEACRNRTAELKDINDQMEEAITSCKNEFATSIDEASSELEDAKSKGQAIIDNAIPTFLNCVKEANFFTCLASEIADVTEEMQGIVSSLAQLSQTTLTASVDARSCINDAERDSRQQANVIFEEIRQCILDASLDDSM